MGPLPPGPTSSRVTTGSLAADLGRLGLRAGQSVLLHASLSSLGRVDGGAATVAAALRHVLGPVGTLVVPAMTMDNSNTSRAHLARVQGMSPRQRRMFRRAMPPFDPASTPGTDTGLVAEHVRTSPGAIRSAHPQSSFAAVGENAERYMSRHALDCHLGEESPLGALYGAGAQVLLLGVGFAACSAFHLAEYRYTSRPPMRRYACVISRNGRPQWWRYRDVELDDSDFETIGAQLEMTRRVIQGRVGAATARLVPVREAVDFATAWMAEHRVAGGTEGAGGARRMRHAITEISQ